MTATANKTSNRKPRSTKATKPEVAAAKTPKVGNIYAAEYRTNLKTMKNKAGSIRIDNDDPTAKQLRDLPLDEVYKAAAAELGDSIASLKSRYGHLNTGMQRMNLGNRIRGAKARKAKTRKTA